MERAMETGSERECVCVCVCVCQGKEHQHHNQHTRTRVHTHAALTCSAATITITITAHVRTAICALAISHVCLRSDNCINAMQPGRVCRRALVHTGTATAASLDVNAAAAALIRGTMHRIQQVANFTIITINIILTAIAVQRAAIKALSSVVIRALINGFKRAACAVHARLRKLSLQLPIAR